MKKTKRIRMIILLAVIAAVAGYAAYMCLTYFFYDDYKACLATYAYETGSEFAPLNDSDPKVEGMVLAAENESLKLYTNLKTTEVAVYDKRSGEIAYSNPPDRNEDPIAAGSNKTALNSQLKLTYYNISMTEAVMYNYDMSVERNQFKTEKLENGIRFIYLFGDMTSPTGLVPPMISPERLEEKILSKVSEKDARTIRNSYIPSEERPGFMELTAGARVSKVGLSKMNKILEAAGYTQADFDADAAAAAGGETVERTTFTVPLEYRLDGDKLLATIPTSQIVETGSGKLGMIEMLTFFGAGSAREEGYMLVPNGSGSLIRFNNGKVREEYNQFVYGMDETVRSFTVVEESEKARMPVFGIKKDPSAIFAEIVSGDALAAIRAKVSGDVNSYNYVYPVFAIRGAEEVSMFGATGVSADIPTVEKHFYKLDLSVSYAFLGPKEASYSGMANYYRNALKAKGVLKPLQSGGDIPFYLDILGGVKRQESILGISYLSVFPMTRFDEAGQIVEAFHAMNVKAVRLNYLGWFNGGYYHDVPKSIRIEGVLGGKRGFYALQDQLTASGGKLFGDVALQRVSFEAEGLDYNWRMENAQYYSGLAVGLGRTNPATMRVSPMGYFESMYNVLSPKYLVRHVDRFLNAMKKIRLTGVSLRDMGDMLSSDKRRSAIINRQESKQILLAQMDKIKAQAGPVMIDGGNAYSWAYASDLVNIPSGHNPYTIVDEEVPFYQMVLHGCVSYTSKPLNLSSGYDKQEVLLKLIETGMSPHYVLSWQNSSEIKYTGMNQYFSTQYRIWLSEAAEIYQKANEVLKHVEGSAMVEHTILAHGLRRMTYDNGCVIYINSSDQEATLDGLTIPAKSYSLEGIDR